MTHDNDEPSAASAGSKPLTFGSLFAGIGGFDLGLERAGMVCKWQVEIEPYARAVLAKHWPDVPRHDDVRTFPTADRDWRVDVICGGFPCQDISNAGRKAGLAGTRSRLWHEYARVVGELRPRYVVVENVSALLERGMDAVLGGFSDLGYDAEWHVIPASAVGAPHRRERVWIVAYTNDESEPDVPKHDEPWRVVPTIEASDWWKAAEPEMVGVADGLQARVDRDRCLGNAVVPQVVEVIGRAIVARG